MVASGPNGFAAYSLSVDPFAERNNRPRQALQTGETIHLVQLEGVQSSLEIDTAAVPPTFNILKRLVQRYYPEVSLGNVPQAGYQAAIREDIAAAKPGADQAAGPERRRGMAQRQAVEPPSKDATSVRQHRVALWPDGRMVGRLHNIDLLSGRPKLIEDVNVFLIRDDQLVAQTRVNRIGVFEIPDLVPGGYALVAAGQDGFGAVGFELTRSEQPDNARWDRRAPFHFLTHRRHSWEVLTANGAADVLPAPFAMALIDDPRNIQAAFNPNMPLAAGPGQLAGAPASNAPMGGPAGGGAGGGAPGGFSGGGSGGVGGLNGLGLAALIASAVAIPLVTNNDSTTPQSPFAPSNPPSTSMPPPSELFSPPRPGPNPEPSRQ
jgi:hypothetical protein